MNPWRAALLGGLLQTTAFSVWWLAGMTPGSEMPDQAPAFQTLVYAQALTAALLLPTMTDGAQGRACALAPLLCVAASWPLLSLLLLSGGISLRPLIGTQLVLAVWVLLPGSLGCLLERWLDRPAAAKALLQAANILIVVYGVPHVLRVAGS